MKNWFSEHKKSILLSTLGTLLPIFIGCLLYDRLPDQLALHWGADGAVDRYGGKGMLIFGLPLILAGINLLGMMFTALDPKQQGQNKKALRIIFWIMPLLSVLISTFMYCIALGSTVETVGFICPTVGILMAVMGNYMPKVKQNSTLGIKIYWTLSNEENWNKTHRMAGKLWTVCGVLMPLLMLLPTGWMMGMFFAVILMMVLVPVLYSRSIYKKHQEKGIVYKAAPKSTSQKAVTVFAALIVIATLVVFMFSGDITYTPGDTALRIEASFTTTAQLQYDRIDALELRENFNIGSRVIGFGSPRLSTGIFQNQELGNYNLYAYTTCNTVILIQCGENLLVINAETPEETTALYQTLLEKIN